MIGNNIINKLKILGFKNIFLFICFVYLVSSINSPFYLYIKLDTLKVVINFFRGISPIVILPLLIIYLIYQRQELKFDFGYFLFFLYLLFQFFSYLIYDRGNFFDLYWLVCGLATISLFYIIRNDKKINILFLKFFFILLAIITSKFSIDLYREYLDLYNVKSIVSSFDVHSFYGFSSMQPYTQFFDQPVPRSSGIARMLLLIFSIIFVHYIYSDNSQLNKIISVSLLIFLVFTIFQIQNRSTLYFIFIIIFLFIFLKIYNLNAKKKFFVVFFIFVLPFLFHLFENKIRLNIIKIIVENTKKNLFLEEADKLKFNEVKSYFNKHENKITTQGEFGEFEEFLSDSRIFATTSSGRLLIWKNSIELIRKNIFGYGPQADRNLLDQNASNFYLYSLLCGGIFSFVSILVFSLLIFFKLIKLIFFEKILIYKKKFLVLSILLVSFFYFRSLTEISFGIFGIDMIVFFIAYNIINLEKSRV